MDNLASGDRRPAHARLSETPAFLIAIGLCVVCLGYWLLLTKVYHFSNDQAAELATADDYRGRGTARQRSASAPSRGHDLLGDAL